MNKVLIDSSVWIHYFRQGKSKVAENVDLLLDQNRAVLCGMVELEILQGVRGKEQLIIQDLFQALDFLETKREDFISAGLILNQLRSRDITIPSSDCLIAAQSIHNKVSLYTLDKDFDVIPALKKFL